LASVTLERLGQQVGVVRPVLEEVNNADGGIDFNDFEFVDVFVARRT
jgi:hypothetical protein